MCGIAGIATTDGLNADDRVRLDAMLTAIAHRGPDDVHVLADRQAAIGARRLSIIDLSTGRQPVTDESGSIVATLNGELYEYIELRESLAAAGHTLRTRGDTETIAHLFEDLGERFVERMYGMFAIAVWDARHRRLVLARDRLGKKPLYYRTDGNRLLYGSELKALMADPDLERRVDTRSVAQYLQYGYVPGARTILEGVRRLPPASTLVWDGGEPVVTRYWEPAYAPKIRRDFDEDVDECLDLVRHAVKVRLRSDVPVGAFLSGGVDSSLVLALAADQSASPLRTYSIGFEEQGFDELPFARRVARHFGTIHEDEVVRMDAAGALPGLAHAFDEPLADTSALPTYRIAQIASGRVKVVLTGDGGDEAFGGYRTYRRQALMGQVGRYTGALQAPGAAALATAMPALGRGVRLRGQLQRWARDARLPADDRFVAMMSMTTPEQRARLLPRRDHARLDGILLETLVSGPADPIDRILRADTLTYLPDDLLVKMDRATMAWSVEARAPLLDHRIIDFAGRVPASRKVRASGTKILLRAVADRVLPPEVSRRPKMGFTVPIDAWFRGDLALSFRDLVLAPDAVSRDLVDTAGAAALLDDHAAGRDSHGQLLWALLMLEAWARAWVAPTAGLPSNAGAGSADRSGPVAAGDAASA